MPGKGGTIVAFYLTRCVRRLKQETALMVTAYGHKIFIVANDGIYLYRFPFLFLLVLYEFMSKGERRNEESEG